jgi:hypothetical protein
MSEPILPLLKPIPIKDRISVVYIEKGNLDVLDGAFVVVDKTGVRMYAAGQPGGVFPARAGMNRAHARPAGVNRYQSRSGHLREVW